MAERAAAYTDEGRRSQFLLAKIPLEALRSQARAIA